MFRKSPIKAKRDIWLGVVLVLSLVACSTTPQNPTSPNSANEAAQNEALKPTAEATDRNSGDSAQTRIESFGGRWCAGLIKG